MKKLEQEFYGYVESSGIEERRGFQQYVLSLNTCSGRVNMKYWNVNENNLKPKSDDFVKIILFNYEEALEEHKTYSSISLDSSIKNKPFHANCEVVRKEDVPEDVLKLIFKDRKEQVEKAKKLLIDDSYWVNKDYGKFLVSIISENKDFVTCPAAKKNHHAFKGGLLVHTAEVFSHCMAIANCQHNIDFYSMSIDTDVLYLSAWLHDIGKIELYSINNENTIEYDRDGERYQSHIVRSNSIFNRYAYNENLDRDFINKVSHCILTHQDRKEWNSPQEPETVEGIILAKSDHMSSEISKRENGEVLLSRW